MITLLRFQREAVEELTSELAKRFDGETQDKTVLLQAPTGSGKTVMVGCYLANLAGDSDKDTCVIFLAPYSLHAQAARSLSRILGTGQKITTPIDLGGTKSLERNEVLFLNWASVSGADNILRTGSEDRASLESLCKETRKLGRRILVVIDESHHSADTANARELLDLVRPAAILEMSATPRGKKTTVTVSRARVRKEGLIKTRVVVNLMDDALVSRQRDDTVEAVLLEQAARTRDTLQEAYANASIPVNPLLLIQIPDAEQGKARLVWLEDKLRSRGITRDNGRLAVWLNEESGNFAVDPRLLENEGSIDVLVFKQRIATGWDCPRAQVLLKLRNRSKKERFDVQTLGRIMRMPERRHYTDPQLNQGYVFHSDETYTPAEDMTVATDIARLRPDVAFPIIPFRVVKNAVIETLTLRQVERIGSELLSRIGVDENASIEDNRQSLRSRGTKLRPSVTRRLLTNAEIGGEDETLSGGTKIDLRQSSQTNGMRFNEIIRNCAGSRDDGDALALELYELLYSTLGLTTASAMYGFIVGNRDEMELRLSEAIESVAPMAKRRSRGSADYNWIAEPIAYYNTAVGEKDLYEERPDTHRCAYVPCFVPASKRQSEPERAFEDWLEGDGAEIVTAWIKNGESPGSDISLPYLDPASGEMRNFFPDYSVMLADGTFALYETKELEEAWLLSSDERARNESKFAALKAWVVAAAPDEKRAGAFVCKPRGSGALLIIEKEPPTREYRGDPLTKTMLFRYLQPTSTV